MKLKGKKLLILAGAGVHTKVVQAAKEIGVYTIVTDYLVDSPAKLISDESWMLNITDVDGIVEHCLETHVDGVINLCIDPGQIPYQAICERLNFPCFGTKEQFETLTNKRKFKDFCAEHDVDIISEYTDEDVDAQRIKFPVFVKPVDSRGSRGQTICHDYKELDQAIQNAQNESTDGGVLIETYIDNKTSFQVTYFFIDGKPYLIRTVDGYKGTVEDNLDRVALCSVSPSRYTNEYMCNANDKFIGMLKALGIENGPVMAQGFNDHGVFRFYDPGLRFPGTDFELIYEEVFGIDLIQAMIVYALTGKLPDLNIPEDSMNLNNCKGAVLFPTLNAGEIGEIEGLDEIGRDPNVIMLHTYHKVGDLIRQSNTTEQRIAEIDILAKDNLNSVIYLVQRLLDVRDTQGKCMIYKPFNVERLN